MTFTESDAENNGLIKREAGRECWKVAQRNSPEIAEHFAIVCEDRGQEPADVLGEMVVRSLDAESYAMRVFNTEVNKSKIQKTEIREDDLQMVQRLTDSLNMNDDGGKDPIDQLIESRIQATASGPLGNINDKRGSDGSSSDAELVEYLERMNNRMENIEESIDLDGGRPDSPEDGQQSLDEIFDDGDEEGGEVEDGTHNAEVEEQTDDTDGGEDEDVYDDIDGTLEGIGDVGEEDGDGDPMLSTDNAEVESDG